MKKIVVICKGGFGKEMLDYLSDTFSADSGYEFERIQDLFPDDKLFPTATRPSKLALSKRSSKPADNSLASFIPHAMSPRQRPLVPGSSSARLHTSGRGPCWRRM
jgi:hypothetical protein